MGQVQAMVAVQAAAAARSAAGGIADMANTAIVLTAPFTGKDVDADAAEVAGAALQMDKEQVASEEPRPPKRSRPPRPSKPPSRLREDHQ
ncbi:hypothetical protein [Streptomyces sp. NPDC007369]|uniref:hypothetical protein n=1 Tax=Streptomyces sp. NPDC007369 TaxID=3154589 RepID=UPI0033EB77FA